MKAFLIDPTESTIDAIEVTDRAQIAALIGYDTLETDAVGDAGDCLFFDEECFIRGTQGRFQIDSLIPVAGKGVVIGDDGAGVLSDVTISLDELRGRTRFL